MSEPDQPEPETSDEGAYARTVNELPDRERREHDEPREHDITVHLPTGAVAVYRLSPSDEAVDYVGEGGANRAAGGWLKCVRAYCLGERVTRNGYCFRHTSDEERNHVLSVSTGVNGLSLRGVVVSAEVWKAVAPVLAYRGPGAVRALTLDLGHAVGG